MMDQPSSHKNIPTSNNGDIVNPTLSLLNYLYRLIYSSILRSIIYIFVVFACSTVAATIALPLLLAAFVVTRILQFFFACGYMFDKATKLKTIIKLKLFLRTCIYLVILYFLCVAVILYAVANVPNLVLNDVVLYTYSIKYWIKIYFILFGICTVSYFSSIFSIRFVMLCIPLEYHTFKSGSHAVSDTVHEIIDCLILLFFAEQQIVSHLGFLKKYRILGFYPVHRLCHVLILILVFHDLIGLSSHIFVWRLKNLVSHQGSHTSRFQQKIGDKYLGRKSLVYWASGLKPSIMFTFTSLMLLLTWVLYFMHLINKHEGELSESRVSDNKKVLRVGTWSSLCLFFFSILWVIKSCILLVLENNIVFKKFGWKISYHGKDLYYLGVLGRGIKDFLKLQYEYDVPSLKTLLGGHQCDHKVSSSESSEKPGFMYKIIKAFSCCEQISRDHIQAICTKDRGWGGISCFMLSVYPVFLVTAKARYQHPKDDPDDNLDGETPMKLSIVKRKQVKEDLMKQQDRNSLMLYDLQKMVHYFLGAKKAISRDKYTYHLLKHLQRRGTDSEKLENTVKELIINGSEKGEQEWVDFTKTLAEEQVLEHSQYSHPEKNFVELLETWLEEAHNRCMVLTNTLSSARKIVESLDRIMSFILVILTFIVWLLLTGLTSTNGIILVGSPIVSFSFIFGQACSTFFQGIVFVYVMHPFNVGDLCVIDNDLLEVIMIGIWETTFTKVDTQEKVMYPNTDLMVKKIINHKTDFDWSDSVEIYVDPNSMKSAELKAKIEKEIKGAPDKYESDKGIMIDMAITAEEKLKIVVKLRYKPNLRTKTTNYFECYKEKLRRRTEFMQNIVDGHRTIEISTKEESNFGVCIQY